MGRYTFSSFDKPTTPRYVVLFDLQWRVIECQRLEPAAEFSGAIAAAIKRLEVDGWQAEGTPDYGFIFVRRAGDRRLLMLTEKDPADSTRQSFSPFGSPNSVAP
jgi:hypothetical protein